MAITALLNKPTAGEMAGGKYYAYTATTTVDTYEVIATLNISGMQGVTNYLTVTGNNLLFKFEYSKDNLHWTTSIEDYPVAKGTTAELSAVRNALSYRVSVKPAVAGSHGSCSWLCIFTATVVPPEYRSATAYESITVTNAAAVGFTLATMGAAFRANITVEDNPIRIRWDGTSPTTSEGHLLQAGDSMILDFSADLYHFRAIATGGNSKIRVTYSR